MAGTLVDIRIATMDADISSTPSTPVVVLSYINIYLISNIRHQIHSISGHIVSLGDKFIVLGSMWAPCMFINDDTFMQIPNGNVHNIDNFEREVALRQRKKHVNNRNGPCTITSIGFVSTEKPDGWSGLYGKWIVRTKKLTVKEICEIDSRYTYTETGHNSDDFLQLDGRDISYNNHNCNKNTDDREINGKGGTGLVCSEADFEISLPNLVLLRRN